MRRLTVIFLRHGEREDEAHQSRVAHSDRPLSRRQVYDPRLTALGYQQADAAMYQIVRALQKSAEQRRRIAVFTSPLRRAVGTSLMLSTAVSGEQCSSALEWILPLVPTPEFGEEAEDTTSKARREPNSTTHIPIVVLDGLSDCTAVMQMYGGHEKVIASGWISCATPWNDYREATNGMLAGTDPGVMRYELHRMARTIRDQTTVYTAGWERQETLVQFYKMKKETSDRYVLPLPSFAPMTSPVALQDPTVREYYLPKQMRQDQSGASLVGTDKTETNDSKDKSQNKSRRGGRDKANKTCPAHLNVVDHAVMAAARANADTVIMVTHREAFKDVIKYRCPGVSLPGQLDVPYCGVGTFTVDVDVNDVDYSHMEWQIFSFERSEKFDVDCLPDGGIYSV